VKQLERKAQEQEQKNKRNEQMIKSLEDTQKGKLFIMIIIIMIIIIIVIIIIMILFYFILFPILFYFNLFYFISIQFRNATKIEGCRGPIKTIEIIT